MRPRCKIHHYAKPCPYCAEPVYSAKVGAFSSGRLIPRYETVDVTVRVGGVVTMTRADGSHVVVKFSKASGNVHPYQGRFSLGGRLFQASLKEAETITRYVREQCGFAPPGEAA